MTVINKNSYDAWLKKRKLTTIAFAIHAFFINCEYGIFVVNVWLYISKLVKPSHPTFFYSLISVSYLLSASISSVFICQYADNTRNVRRILFVLNTLMILGNLIYAIPFSPWILLFGRLLAGMAQPERSIIAGELSRCYPADELSTVFAMIGAAGSFGFMAAPGINIMFTSFHVWIGGWHINYTNVSGFYISFMFAIAQFMCFFMISDLSKEYDLKKEAEFTNAISEKIKTKISEKTPLLLGDEQLPDEAYRNTSILSSTSIVISSRISTAWSLDASPAINPPDEEAPSTFMLSKQLFSHYDTLLLLSLQFLETFFIFSFDMCLPVLIIDRLNWSVTVFNIIQLATGVTSIIPLLILMCKTIKDETIFYTSVVTIFAYALLQIIQIIWAKIELSVTVNMFLAVVYPVLFSVVVLIRDVFLGSFLARMVSSKCQALTDSVRVAISRLGAVAAMSSSVYALEKIEIIGTVYVLVITVFGVLLIVRRATIRQPKVVIS